MEEEEKSFPHSRGRGETNAEEEEDEERVRRGREGGLVIKGSDGDDDEDA